jgi:hypothetical protein
VVPKKWALNLTVDGPILKRKAAETGLVYRKV